MGERKRILHANLNNQGGAFSVAYEAQKKLQEEYVFDYFFPDEFIENDVYTHLMVMGSRCIGSIHSSNRFLKQYNIFKTFYKYLCENNYEVVHIHADTAWKICVYYLAAKKAKIERIIVHSHSSGINGHYKRLNYCLHILAKPIIKQTKYKCACSDIAARWMFDSTDKVSIIRNGVDIQKFIFNSSSRERVRRELSIQDRIVIGSVSDFSYQKNPEFIYELVKSFKASDKYIFLFVGNRANGCLLKELVDLDVEVKNAIFVGSVTNVQDYLSAMDVFILPSRFEGLPMCALEAQVSGLYTMISDKVSQETQCSIYFKRLRLDTQLWKNEIEHLNLIYNRNDSIKHLTEEKANATYMADEFRKLYEGEI